MRTSDSQRLTSKKASNSKSILNKKYKNLLQRGSKKRSLDLKKKEKRHYNFQKLTNENISRNTSLVLKKKSRKSNKQGTRPFNKRKRTFTGRVLENYANKTHGFNEFNGTSHEKINSKSFLKENQKSHENVRSNTGCDFFVKKRKSKVEKILKNLQKKGRISCKENSSEQSLRTRNKSFSFRMRKSVSLTGNQNLFNEHFISREQPEEQGRSKRTVGKNNTSRHLKSSSMSQLGVTKTPSVLLESNDTNQAPLDSKRTPLDNYFKIYLTQCKSIKFTSPAGEHEDKVRDSSTVQEHNAKNSEFIQNLKRYLSTERMDFKEENLKQQIEEANLILNQQDADFILEGETFEDMALKTKRKFNKEPEKKLSLSPEPNKAKDEPYNRFEFSAKVLGNLDQRRRQKFFDKENGMKYLKQWKEKKVKQERHVEREVTKEKQHPSMDKFSKTLGPKQKKRLKNYKSGLRKKRKSFINQNKKRYGSFRRNVSREKSFDSLNMSVSRRRPNSSMKSSNSRISGSYTRKKSRGKRKMKIHTFDSSLMTKEIKELTDELRKLKFTKEKISEFNDIFLPYLDFTFNLEIKNKRLQHELKEAQEKQKVAEKKLSEVQTGAETKMAEFKKQFDLKFEAERNLRKNLEKNLSESENNLKELNQQNIILNDVLKGICQERENEEKPSIDTKTSFKVESLKDSIPDYNEGRNRRRDSVRRSGEFNRSRCSLSVPKLDNNDVIMELRYELKIAHEEIQDFKNSLKVEKECQLFKIKQFVHTLKKYKEGGSIKLEDYIDRSFKIYYDNASPDNFEELTEKAQTFIESKELLTELRRDNNLKAKEIQFLREENIKMMKILESYEIRIEDLTNELKHCQDKLESTGSLSYRNMGDVYNNQKPNYQESPELILEVDESLSDYCHSGSTGKKRHHQNVYDEDQVRIHVGCLTKEEQGGK